MSASSSPSSAVFANTLTDLMTSLAVIFILLLVVFLKQAHDHSQKAKNLVEAELAEVLTQKNLKLDPNPEDPLTLSVKVGENQLRFNVGSDQIPAASQAFIDSFFVDFAKKVCKPALRDQIDSIVIEGHTDSSGETLPQGVKKNIQLSQKRSFSVLERALQSLQNDSVTYECLLGLASATGRGSRVPVKNAQGTYLADESRRVEIKIRVRSSEQAFQKLAQPNAIQNR
jgi:outer membrane protein OmpA-like peptidoglycan-associated protein